jgi:hypothetical protein
MSITIGPVFIVAPMTMGQQLKPYEFRAPIWKTCGFFLFATLLSEAVLTIQNPWGQELQQEGLCAAHYLQCFTYLYCNSSCFWQYRPEIDLCGSQDSNGKEIKMIQRRIPEVR